METFDHRSSNPKTFFNTKVETAQGVLLCILYVALKIEVYILSHDDCELSYAKYSQRRWW